MRSSFSVEAAGSSRTVSGCLFAQSISAHTLACLSSRESTVSRGRELGEVPDKVKDGEIEAGEACGEDEFEDLRSMGCRWLDANQRH